MMEPAGISRIMPCGTTISRAREWDEIDRMRFHLIPFRSSAGDYYLGTAGHQFTAPWTPFAAIPLWVVHIGAHSRVKRSATLAWGKRSHLGGSSNVGGAIR